MIAICSRILLHINKNSLNKPSAFQVDDLIEMYYPVSAFLVVLAVDDVSSLDETISILNYLQEEGCIRTTSTILVANKIDLVRNRVITDQG